MTDADSTPPPQFGTPPPSPPPQSSDGVSLGGPATSSSPAGSGAASAPASGPVPSPVAAAVLLDTHITPILDEFEAQLKEQFGQILLAGKTHVDALVADFEAALASGHTELAAITDELKRGGIVGRLAGVEMALASHASAALQPSGHDGHDLLQTWFNGIKSTFERVVAGVAADKKQAALAAGDPVPPALTLAPAPAPAPPASPATAQIAALGIPQFQPPPRL